MLQTTNIMSAIGLIKILRITKAGNVLVAGPSTVLQIKHLIKILNKYNLNKILIDGAFSKIAFSSISDAIIYSIGASYSYNLDKVIRDSAIRLKILGLPKIDIGINLSKYKDIVLIDSLGNIKKLDVDSTIAAGKNIIEKITLETKYIYIPKAISKTFVEEFIENRNNLKCDIILKSPTSLILDENLIKHLLLLDQKIFVLNQVNVVAVTYNPYSPYGYIFDNEKFRNELEKSINLPIFNVLEER